MKVALRSNFVSGLVKKQKPKVMVKVLVFTDTDLYTTIVTEDIDQIIVKICEASQARIKENQESNNTRQYKRSKNEEEVFPPDNPNPHIPVITDNDLYESITMSNTVTKLSSTNTEGMEIDMSEGGVTTKNEYFRKNQGGTVSLSISLKFFLFKNIYISSIFLDNIHCVTAFWILYFFKF